MAYLIDSDVLTSYLDGEREAITLIDNVIPAGISISIVTYMETYQGVLRATDPTASERRHSETISRIAILPFTESTARQFAQLRHQLSAEGKRVRSRVLDLMIAATALEHNLTLPTARTSPD